jgi:AcrR family transcriptional regulator
MVGRVAAVTQEADPRRRLVLDAAAELVLDRGLGGATARGIADRAGTSVASLYRLFPDKESVLSATLRAQLAELAAWQRERLPDDGCDASALFCALFDGYAAWCASRPDYRALWFTGGGGAVLQEIRWRSTSRLVDVCVSKLGDASRRGPGRAVLVSRVTVVVAAADRVVDASYRYPANRKKLMDSGRTSLLRYLDVAGTGTASA